MLNLTDISFQYGSQKVLSSADLTVKKGQITSILGPNGGGKTTLLKVASGILTPSGGAVTLDGNLLSSLSAKRAAQKISYLAQSRDIPAMTVSQLVLHGRFPYIGYPRRYSEADKAIAKQAMEQAGVLPYASKMLSTLSGGMRQCAYVAMALCQDTDYILLDEPAVYLDISNQIKLMDMLSRLAQKGKGVGIVMHDIPLALKYSQHISVLNRGTTVMDGTPDQIYASGIINTCFDIELKRTLDENQTIYYVQRG